MAIDPRGSDLKRFLADDSGDPVIMLKLLRFVDGGRETYQHYAKAIGQTFLPRYGGEIIYAGECSTALVAEEGQLWDAVVLVATRRAPHSVEWSPTPNTRRSRPCAPTRCKKPSCRQLSNGRR